MRVTILFTKGLYDNTPVPAITNFTGMKTAKQYKCYDKKEKQNVYLSCSAVVEIHNVFLKGVDKAGILKVV